MATWRKWTSTVLVNGQPEPNVKVCVYEPGTTNEIPIYEDEGVTQITQPILTDSQGRYAFFVDVDAYPEIRLYLEKDGVDFSEANEDLDGVPVPGAGGGAGTFTELTDTPSSYVGRGGDVVVVKATEDGIETQPWPVTGTVLNFFLSDDAADIGSYYCMYPAETGDSSTELTSSSLSAGDDQLLWSFVTEAGQPGIDQLALGAYTATLFLKKTGNKDVRVYWKLFKRDTGGTETEILQSAVSDHLTAENSQYLISGYLNEDRALDPTDRLVLKLYANVSGTGTDVTVTLTMEGDYDSRLAINVLSSAFDFDRLSDTPSSKTGAAGKYVRVSTNETILEFDGAADMETESRTVYVDGDNGSDTMGDGSEGSPFQTYEKALSTVRNVIADGVTITIHLKAATNQYTMVDTGRLCIGAGQLVIEGEMTVSDSGSVSSATAVTITDSSKSWTVDEWAGKVCKITSGGTDYYRIIDSNTADTLTLCGRLSSTPSAGDSYEILDWGSAISGTWKLTGTGNNIALEDLYIPAIEFTGGGRYSISRCKFDMANFPVSIGSDFLYGTVRFDMCDINGSGGTYGIYCVTGAAATLQLYRTRIHNAQYLVRFSSPAGKLVWSNGSIADGGTSLGFRLQGTAYCTMWTPPVNGATDVTTIRNCDTGLKVESGAGASRTGVAYVTYSGNTTDRTTDDGANPSATCAWYSD